MLKLGILVSAVLLNSHASDNEKNEFSDKNWHDKNTPEFSLNKEASLNLSLLTEGFEIEDRFLNRKIVYIVKVRVGNFYYEPCREIRELMAKMVQ
ncbi:hypothetical protein [Candidatus Odyssella acanthamoebae]|uniref:Uncharacterized protein n=1 Tax=Candidatus Odyssella acanthamoebae TaxID=91604 RepID=A0A077AZ21_9PROT|nr:hypothetical protein [Candidatus Paracaedibacter acanthamoebae]AIK97264.1 hypothetical protein ID47_11760 [Candidatus Paracaedibacter acanthamoebae]